VWHVKSSDNSSEEDLPDVFISNDLDLVWRLWVWAENTGWRHLPMAGGLLDQPESLMDDLMAVQFASSRLRESLHGE